MDFQYKDEHIHLGLNIAYYRKLNGFTQAMLAEKLDINTTHITKLENARRGVSLDLIFRLADVLGIPVYKLFEFRD